ncbi:intracellular short-chain-length polyhydroxyalkanoate depolymerase [Litchfieldia alkalitelluris]|uniref:intracellular short-chain-length polyhydroxyalkanoate depolymerase n=1 Tax=Litchfieldia alkalitelluris TaxID=304268 RepID=UPI000998C26B|nr:alpha/beta hydrolase [Litchfieldia alkalitelluris]
MSKVELKTVNLVNGETLGYREREGGEKVILLIHGNMTSSKHWDLLLENMDESYKLYAVDMRGFGLSSYVNRVSSIKNFSDDIKLFVDELGLDDFAIMGWSTGGAVGMQFVADYPGYCNKLILLASASTRGYPFFGTDEAGQLDPTKRLKTIEDIEGDLARTIPIQQAYDTKNKEYLQAVWNALIYRDNRPSEERYNQYVDDMMTQRNLKDVYYSLNTFNISEESNGLVEGNGLVKNIMIPVLVLRGNQDLVITEGMAREILHDLEEVATYRELTGCGHSPLVDDLNQLMVACFEFLEQKELSQ